MAAGLTQEQITFLKKYLGVLFELEPKNADSAAKIKEVVQLVKQLDTDLKKFHDRHVDVLKAQAEYGDLADTWDERINEVKDALKNDQPSGSQLDGLKANLLKIVPELKALVERLDEQLGDHDAVEASYASEIARCDALLDDIRTLRPRLTAWNALSDRFTATLDPEPFEAEYQAVLVQTNRAKAQWRQAQASGKLDQKQAAVLPIDDIRKALDGEKQHLAGVIASMGGLAATAKAIEQKADEIAPLLAHLARKGVPHPGADQVAVDQVFVSAAAALRDYDAVAMNAAAAAIRKIETDARALLENSSLASDKVALGELQTEGARKLCEQFKRRLEGRLAKLETDAAALKNKVDAAELDPVEAEIQPLKTEVAKRLDWAKLGAVVPAVKPADLLKVDADIARKVDGIERELSMLEVTLDPGMRPTVAWEKFEKLHHGSVQDGVNVDPWDDANKDVPLCAKLRGLKATVLDTSKKTPVRFDCLEQAKKIVFKAREQILAQPRGVLDAAQAPSTYHKEAAALRARIGVVKGTPAYKAAIDPSTASKFTKVKVTLEKYFAEADLYLKRETAEALESARMIVKQAEDFAKTTPPSGLNVTEKQKAQALKEQLANKEKSAKLESELLALWPLYHSAENVDKAKTDQAVGGATSFDSLRNQADLDLKKLKAYRKALALVVRQAYADWEKLRREYQGHAKRAQRILEGFEAEIKNIDGQILGEATSPAAKEIQARLNPTGAADTVKTKVEAVNTAYEKACVQANDGQYEAARQLLRSIDTKIAEISAAVKAEREAALAAIKNPPPDVDLEWKPLDTKIKDSGYGFNTTIDSVNYQGGQLVNANGELVASPELQEMAKNLNYRLAQMEKLCALGEDPLDVARRVFEGIPENFWPPRAMKLIAMFRAAEAEFAEEQLLAEAEKFLGKNDLVKGVDELREAVEAAKQKPMTPAEYEKTLEGDALETFKDTLDAGQQQLIANASSIMGLFGDPSTGRGTAADAVAKQQLQDAGIPANTDVGTAAGALGVANSGINVLRAGYALCDAQASLNKENRKDDYQARGEDELQSPVQKRIYEYERMRAIAQIANSSLDLILGALALGNVAPGLGIAANAKDMIVAFGEAARYFAMLEDTDWARRASKKDPDSVTYLGLKMQAKEEGYAGGKQCFTAATKIAAIVGDVVTMAGVAAPVGFAINAGAKVFEYGGNIVFQLKDWGSVSYQKALIKRAKASPPDYQAIEEVFTDTRKYARFCIAWNCVRGDAWARAWVLNRGLTESDMDNVTTTTRIIREYINVTQQGVLGDTEDDMDQAFGDTLGARAAKAVGRGIAAGPKAAAKWVEDKSMGRDRSKERDFFRIGKKGAGPWAAYWTAEKDKACDAGLFVTKDLNRFKKHFETLDAAQAALAEKLKLGDAAPPEEVRACIEDARAAFGVLGSHVNSYSPVANDQQPHRGTQDLMRYIRMELSQEEARFNTNAKAFEAGQLLMQKTPQIAGDLQNKMKVLADVLEDPTKSKDDVAKAEAELETLLDDQAIAAANKEVIEAAQIELQNNIREFQQKSLALTQELLSKEKLKTSFGDLSPKTSASTWVDESQCDAFFDSIGKKLKLPASQKDTARKRFDKAFQQLEGDLAGLHGKLVGIKASYVVDKRSKVRTMSIDGKIDSDGRKWVFKDVYKKELERRLTTIQSNFDKAVAKAASDVLTYSLDANGEIKTDAGGQPALSAAGQKLSWNVKGDVDSPFKKAADIMGAAQKWSNDKKDAVAKGWVESKTGLKKQIGAFATMHRNLRAMLKAEAPDKRVQANWRIELAKLQTTLEKLPVLTAQKTTHPGMDKYKAACLSDLAKLEADTLADVDEIIAKTEWSPPDSFFNESFFAKAKVDKFLNTCEKRWNLNRKSVPKALLKSVEKAERRLDIWNQAEKPKQSDDLERYRKKAEETLTEMKAQFGGSFIPVTKGKPPATHVSVTRMKEVCPAVIDGIIQKVNTDYAALPA
jgi:hypothetical protein